MSLRLFGVSLAATGLVVVSAVPAAAITPDAVAKALGAALTEGTNIAATYEAAKADGGNVVIKGLAVSRLSGDQSVRFDQVVVESPTTGDKGVFQSPLITFSGGTLTGTETGSIATASLTDATVLDASKLKGDSVGEGVLFKSAEIDTVSVAHAGEPGTVTIDRVSAQSGNVAGDVSQDSKGTVENIALSPDFFAQRSFTPAMIGLDNLAFDVSWDYSRDLAAKMLTIRDFTIHIHDGGSLSVDGVLGNLPDPRALDNAGAGSKASKAELHKLMISYHDELLVGHVLDALAKTQGLTREAYIEQLTAALPFLLITLNNPAFQSEVTGAVTSFLKDPKSFTISVEPDTPVSGTQLMSMMKTDPGTVLDRLKPSVTANSAE